MVPERVAYNRVVLTTGRASGIFGGLANRPIVVRFWWFWQFWKALEKVDYECHGFRALATTLNNGNFMGLALVHFQKLAFDGQFSQILCSFNLSCFELLPCFGINWRKYGYFISFGKKMDFESQFWVKKQWRLGNLENKVSECQLWIIFFFSNFFKFCLKMKRTGVVAKSKKIFFQPSNSLKNSFFPSSCLPLSRQTNDNLGDYFSDFWQLWNASEPW